MGRSAHAATVVHYQVLDTLGPPSLGRLLQYPEPPAVAGAGDVEEAAGAAGPLAEIKYPLTPRIELTLDALPSLTTFDLYLVFQDHDHRTRALQVRFRRSGASMTWLGDVFPDGLGALTGLADTGNRSHWDRMFLHNYNACAFAIDRVRIHVRYGNLPSGCSTDIPIVNRVVDQALPALWFCFPGALALNVAAVESRRAWAGVTDADAWVVQLAAEDFGKSGSDGADAFGANPKYDGRDELLCSEFVSWYLHQAVLPWAAANAFRDIVGTEQLDDLFDAEGRLYYYHLGQQRWLNMDNGAVYTPRSGDFLERRGEDGAEHSMIVLRWDAVAKVATVINGPWPVTLRTVAVDELERNGGKDFRVGRIGPM
jgi:hypothetical protein